MELQKLLEGINSKIEELTIQGRVPRLHMKEWISWVKDKVFIEGQIRESILVERDTSIDNELAKMEALAGCRSPFAPYGTETAKLPPIIKEPDSNMKRTPDGGGSKRRTAPI